MAIEQLACCDPAGIDLEITHWSTRALAQVAVQRKIVPRIAHSTVSLILRSASLQPHRFRYWKTPTLNEQFRQRAARILWVSDLQRRVAGEACFAPLRRNYERIEHLAARDEVVLALDEKPNIQVLERRCATRRLRPHQIEQQEFEYIRHGTVNFLAALVIHSGKMHGWCLERKNSEPMCAVLRKLFQHYRTARRLHLLWDGDPSHTSAATRLFLREYRPWVRVLVPTFRRRRTAQQCFAVLGGNYAGPCLLAQSS